MPAGAAAQALLPQGLKQAVILSLPDTYSVPKPSRGDRGHGWKRERNRMELEFDRDVIQGYEVLADGTVCQEETLESIVPDACPDILRIVAV